MMKKYNYKKMGLRRALALMALAFLALPFTSCSDGFIFDEEGDCTPKYYVKYVFDMNMQYADAFPSKVESVTLFMFDKTTGELAATYTESGEALKADGYMMKVDVDPGEYELLAWCGLENNDDHFTLPEAITLPEHAHCTMARDYDETGRAFQNNRLNSLFHGKIYATFPEEYGEYVVTVPLIKDTNNINISMQHVAGEPLTADMFTVTMTEGNGHLAHDNSIIEDEDIDFLPWHVADGIVDITGSRADDEETPLNYFKAEISTSRLMADRNPRINITDNATGEVVYSIPIVQWALEFRSAVHSEMDDQEYLDREDEYNVMLYLDNKDDRGWLAATIYINGWRVVNHDNTEIGH